MLKLIRLFRRLIAFPSLAETEAGLWASRGGPVLFAFPIYRVDGKRHFEILGRSRRLPVLGTLLVILAVSILGTAGTGNAETTAIVLAGAVGAASTFVIPLLKTAFRLNIDGKKMTAVAYIVAAVIALVAMWLTGSLNFQDPAELAATVGAAAALQQFVFNLFKDSPKVGPYINAPVVKAARTA